MNIRKNNLADIIFLLFITTIFKFKNISFKVLHSKIVILCIICKTLFNSCSSFLCSYTMLPNIRLPLVSIRLTAITESRKKTKPRNDVSTRHRNLHFLSSRRRFDSSSERGTSSVKSASGLPPGWKRRRNNF